MRMLKGLTSSTSRRAIPPKPKIASVFSEGSCAGASPAFHFPERTFCSARANCLRAEMIRYKAVVAVASSTAPGVFDTTIPCVHKTKDDQIDKTCLQCGRSDSSAHLSLCTRQRQFGHSRRRYERSSPMNPEAPLSAPHRTRRYASKNRYDGRCPLLQRTFRQA